MGEPERCTLVQSIVKLCLLTAVVTFEDDL